MKRWRVLMVLVLLVLLVALLALTACRSTAPPTSPDEILAGTEIVFTGDCPKSWGIPGITCTAWEGPGNTRYVSVHGPGGEPVMILVPGEDGVFEIAWEVGDA